MFRLYPPEAITNGSFVMELPTGFTATTTDSALSSQLTASQITNNGQTITVSGLTLSSGSQNFVRLYSKTLPIAGVYEFKVYFDADGAGPKLLSDPYVLTYTVN